MHTQTHKPGKGQGYSEGRRPFKTTKPLLFLNLHSNKMEHHGMSGWERTILFLQHSFHFIRLFIKYLCTGLSIFFFCWGAVPMTQKHADLFSGTWGVPCGSCILFSCLPLPQPPCLQFTWPSKQKPVAGEVWRVSLNRERGVGEREENENVLHWYWRCQDPSCQSCASVEKINDSA